jgi:diguanylate cyclase (GGDEF)-like protein
MENVKSTQDIEMSINAEQVEILLAQSYLAAYLSLIIVILLAVVLWPVQAEWKVLTWSAALISVGLVRLVIHAAYRRGSPRVENIQVYARAYLTVSILYFSGWGLGGVWVMPDTSPVHQVIMFFFLMGLAGSAMAVFSMSRNMQLIVIVILLCPATIKFLISGNIAFQGMAIGSIIFFLSAIRSSFILWQTMHQNISLKHELEVAKVEAEYLARTDELTNLYNYRAFHEYAERHLSLVKHNKTPLCLIMIDIDDFKSVNDKYGHAVGDFALIHVAALLRNKVRSSDICCRIGGEEFAIILPDTDAQGALDLAENIRREFEVSPLNLDGNIIHLTVSIGLSDKLASVDELVRDADFALYKAKRNGRNRVEYLDGIV